MRLVFFGAGAFAVPPFEAVIEGGYTVAGLVVEPSPVGRPGPEAVAGAWRLPVVESTEIRAREGEERLRQLAPDVQVVVGYRQPLADSIREIPPLGTVKLHPALLPRHRGPAPVPRAILAGDSETGVTSFVLEGPADTGPVLLSRSLPIEPTETTPELERRLAHLGAEVLLETLRGLPERTLKPTPQSATGASEAPAIDPAEGTVDWAKSAEVLSREVRAFYPWPGSTTRFDDQELTIIRAAPDGPSDGEPGTVVATDFNGIVVACGEGTSLRLTQLRPVGLRPMSPSAFVSRFRCSPGARLG